MNERFTLVPLAQVPQALREVEQAIRGQIEGLDAAQLNWQPGPRSWSVLQVLEHLSVTAELYLPLLRHAISGGVVAGQRSSDAPRAGWIERLFLKSLGSNVKLKAPGVVKIRGASDLDPDTTLGRWIGTHNELAEEAHRGRDLDPNRIRITSPLFSLLQLKLGVAFNVLIVHERRHLGQVQRVMAEGEFPGGAR